MSGEGRRLGSVGDMARSLALVLGGVLFLVLVVQRPEGQRVREVEYDAQVAAARRTAAFPVLAPEALPSSWRATSVRLSSGRPLTLHIGFVTPDDRYAAVIQSDAEPGEFVESQTMVGDPAGGQRVGATSWERLEGRTEHGATQRSLVLRREGSAVVVTGSAGFDELAELAGSLR